LGSYIIATIIAAMVLLAGLWMWIRLVAPESVGSAFLIGQFTLLLLLIPRFWQRGMAVSYWQQKMMVPVIVEPIVPQPVPATLIPEPEPPISSTPPPHP
jgi:hypothetical protein